VAGLCHQAADRQEPGAFFEFSPQNSDLAGPAVHPGIEVAVEDQAAKDVAEDLGVTPSAVRLAKSRVMRRLRKEMEGLEDV